jgi:DNA-binding PadR family transcriptional regulator
MSVRLVILGILQQRPLHGYEIKQIITQHMDDWTSIAFGSIYFALNKLSDERLIEKVAVEKSGNRPSRSVYQITDAGKAEFTTLLRQLWAEPERHYYSFDIALFFISALPADCVRRYLAERIAHLEGSLEFLGRHKKEHRHIKEVPKIAFAIMDHSIAHLKAEVKWLRDIARKIEAGELP